MAGLALLAISIGLAACGGSSGGSSSDSGSGSGNEHPHLGLLLALTGIPFATETRKGSEDAAALTGAELDVAGPPTIDPTTAIKDFEDMVATKPDGVTVSRSPPNSGSDRSTRRPKPESSSTRSTCRPPKGAKSRSTSG